jgi:hypothetical protein
MDEKTSQIREQVMRLFEEARQAKGARYEPERFMAFLTEPPARTGGRVVDTFRGRRHFVRFMESAELEFGVCFTNEDWERGFSLDEFVERIDIKLAKPEQAERFACTRLEEARRPDEMIKVGFVVTLLFLAPILAFRLPVVRIAVALLWAGIMGTLVYLRTMHYRHYQKVVARTRERTG